MRARLWQDPSEYGGPDNHCASACCNVERQAASAKFREKRAMLCRGSGGRACRSACPMCAGSRIPSAISSVFKGPTSIAESPATSCKASPLPSDGTRPREIASAAGKPKPSSNLDNINPRDKPASASSQRSWLSLTWPGKMTAGVLRAGLDDRVKSRVRPAVDDVAIPLAYCRWRATTKIRAGQESCRKIDFKGHRRGLPQAGSPMRIRMFRFLQPAPLLSNSPWRGYFLG